ncbi:helix-turn-helix domain-containing protein [Aerococcus urinae]
MSNITPLVLMETIVAEGNITAAAEKLYVSQCSDPQKLNS